MKELHLNSKMQKGCPAMQCGIGHVVSHLNETRAVAPEFKIQRRDVVLRQTTLTETNVSESVSPRLRLRLPDTAQPKHELARAGPSWPELAGAGPSWPQLARAGPSWPELARAARAGPLHSAFAEQ